MISDLISGFFSNPLYIFLTGIILLGLFFWYLAAEKDRVKRTAGTFFILGISVFSLASLFHQGINYGIDIKGGVELTLEVQSKFENGVEIKPTEEDMNQACTILNERLDSTGTSEVQVLHTNNKILIQIPETDPEKIDRLVRTITKMAKLELLPVHPDSAQLEAEGRKVVPGYRKTEYPLLDEDGAPLLDKKTGKPVVEHLWIQTALAAQQQGTYITGKDVKSASPDYSSKGIVAVTLSNDGAGKMRQRTSRMQIGRDRLAVVLNDKVKSAPTVQDVLGKDFQISGLDGKGEAEDLAKALANPLSSDLKVLGQKNVSAQLGQAALEQGAFSGIAGLAAIFLFVFVYYRSAGIVAMVGLTINALILLGLMSLFGFVLTLPGIAGIVLTLGVAVDANVLIYERMREEKEMGRTFAMALRNAYEKAFSAIFDANITSLITAVILFWLASGSIKGFAVTTSVGILTSMIGALVVTRVLFFWGDKIGLMDHPRFLNVFKNMKTIDFMKQRRLAGWGSVILIFLCVAYAGFRGDKCLGIDFMGGSTVTYVIPVGDEQLVRFKDVERVVNSLSLSKTPTAQEFKNDQTADNFKIRCADETDSRKVIDALNRELPGMRELAPPSIESVSSSLGSTFFRTAIWALIAGMLGIMLYLALRYEWSFSFGALVSTLHDMLAVIGLVILTGSELSIIHIGAFLTVAGYSINDTIIIYDRIRERLRSALPSESVEEIMNEAINSTLSRTLLTSTSTLAVLVCLYLFGGPSMRDFSVTMLLGVLVGTYSSVYIASPVVLFCSRRHGLRRELQQADRAAGV